MSEQRWHRVKSVFLKALDLPENERAEFLDRSCGADCEIRLEVEELLACNRDDAFLEGPPLSEEDPDTAPVDPADMAGQSIGSYRLLSTIGHGGMGTVYLAERTQEDIRQRVALKLVRPSLDGGEIVARFLRERRILASLEHPNIAHFLDAGATDDGTPYVVMEYVEGTPIDEFCDSNRLSISRRVELVETLCSAVEAAHQRLVVHRDIKPGNVLVTEDGVPKLLDFGIAKLLAREDSAPDGMSTRLDQRPLTPEYASPEQLLGEPVGTATDVYSLGVLLYLLLTGHLPFDFPSRHPVSVARMVAETEPEKPSSAIVHRAHRGESGRSQEESPTRESISSSQEDSPDRLRRRLAGDLDNIVLKALAKNPGDRYASARHLAEDLRRHLDGLPVLARGQTPAYRAAKFVRRHRLGVLAAAAMAVLGVALLVLSLRYTVDLRRERGVAQERARETAEVTEFLIDLFEVPDPATARGETVTAREILDTGAEAIDTRLADHPLTRAQLMHVIGRVYNQLGLRDRAAAILERSIDLRRKHLDSDDLMVADSLLLLAIIQRDLKEYDRAKELAREMVAIKRALLSPEDPDLAHSKMVLAGCVRFTGKLEEADHLSSNAIDVLRAQGETDTRLMFAIGTRAGILLRRNEFDLAEPLYRDLLERQRRTLGPDHPDVCSTLNNLGVLLRRQHRPAEAEECYREALAILGGLVGEVHPHPVQVRLNLVSVLLLQGKAEEAIASMRRNVDIGRELYGPDHWRVGSSLVNSLGDLLMDAGRYREAETAIRDGLAIYVAALGADHPWSAHARGYLGACLLGLGRRDEARTLIESSLERFRTPEELTRDDWRVLQDILKHLDALDEAESAAPFREILETREAPPGA